MQQPQVVAPYASRAYATEVKIGGLHKTLWEASSRLLPIRMLAWRMFTCSMTLLCLPEEPQRRPQVSCKYAVQQKRLQLRPTAFGCDLLPALHDCPYRWYNYVAHRLQTWAQEAGVLLVLLGQPWDERLPNASI